MTELEIEGNFIVHGKRFVDERGFFAVKMSHSEIKLQTGLDFNVAQINESHSTLGTMRGLHITLPPARTKKLLSVSQGKIVDIIVDLRKGHPNFGQHQLIELDASMNNSILLSDFVGHGFLSVEEETRVTYATTTEHSPKHDVTLDMFSIDVNWEGILEFYGIEKVIQSSRDAAAIAVGNFDGV